MDAHLVLDRAALDAVALARVAAGIGNELGHHEQRDALGAARCVRQARQHQVNDVLGQVVFAGRDEDLGAGQQVGAVGLRFGLGAQDAQIGAAVRLGQAHGAGPDAGHQLGQVGLLQLGRAVRMQRLIRAVRQARVHGPRLVGRVEHLVHHVVDHDRQALAAERRIARQRRPAGLDVLLVGFPEAGGSLDHAVAGIGAALAVAHLVEREHHVRAELAGFLDDLVDGVRVDVRVRRHRLEFGFGAEQFVEHELHVAQRCGVLAHQRLLGVIRCRHAARLACRDPVRPDGLRYGKTESVC
ncbi:hypothetical protein D3C72_1218230 [compost metagenome]